MKTSKFLQRNFKVYPPTLELFGATPQAFEGKQSRSAMRSGNLCLVFWKSEWMKLLFLICMPVQLSTEKYWLTFCHSAMISFMTFLILQCWPVFPNTKAVCNLLSLAEVSSSSFRLTFASSRFDFSYFFSLMNLSHALSNLCLLAREETSLVFSLYAMFARFGTWYSERLCLMWIKLILGFACNCCVDVVWSFTPIYPQVLVLKNLVQDWFLVAFRLQSRFREKMKLFCQILCRKCWGEDFFLNSPTYFNISLTVDIWQKFFYWFLLFWFS